MTESRTHRIASIPGDGVGIEVIAAGESVLRHVADLHRFKLEVEELDWGSERYLQTGAMVPEGAVDSLRGYDAIYLGAIGDPRVPDHLSLWGILLPARQQLDQYVNLRPVRLLPGIESPLRSLRGPIDMLCVRENTEGEYSGVGGRVHEQLRHEVAIQADVFTREGVERVVRYAFEAAMRRRRKLTSVTKSNASRHAFVFWDEVVDLVAAEYPLVQCERILVDAAAAYFVTRPDSFDVVVGSNLFMDILTDLGAAVQGGMGLAASANLNPSGDSPGMFEPVHGSAPDIAGQGIANPAGAIWAAAMMLEDLGEGEGASNVMNALESTLADGLVRTPDLGGKATTIDFGEAVIEHLTEFYQ